jgi:TetR/AcrR family transcriptional regulator, transcriptional repressor of aconitase
VPKISEERKEATRQRLIDAAVEVALDGGPDGVTTRRILEVAGLSAGALYHYFSSKDALYEAIAERFVGIDGLADLATVDVVDAQVAVIGDCFGPRTTSVLGRLRAAALDNPGVTAVLARYDRQIVEQFDQLNHRTVEAGLYRRDLDTAALVETFAVFLDGFSLRPAATFVTGRQRVAACFVDALAERAIEPSHPRAAELRRRALAAVEP